MHVKHATLLKLKHAAFNNAPSFRFNDAACLFITCKITPDNFLATKKDRARFPHTVGLHYFSLGIRCYNADRKQSMGLDDDQ